MSRSELHLGLIGYPLEHSHSPALHGAALAAGGVKGEYRLYPIPPGDAGSGALRQIFEEMCSGRLDGLNVTIPLKQAVIEYLDRLTPAAQAIGAVNTIFRQEGQLVGDNTDAPGFLADLRRCYQPQKAKSFTAMILGAGGAARAVAYALLQDEWDLIIAARRLDQAQGLMDALRLSIGQPSAASGPSIVAVPLTSHSISAQLRILGEGSPKNLLIVNATPVGMYPNVQHSPWLEGVPLPGAAFVYDLVYNPAETALMAQARRAGLRVANGMGMLIEQAALAFERWTGVEASRPAMWLAVTS